MTALSRLPGVGRSYPVCPSTTRSGEALVDPVVAYPHERDGEPYGVAVIGGYRYRGRELRALSGDYVFGDLSGRLFAASPRPPDEGLWPMRELRLRAPDGEPWEERLLSFGRDPTGELYVLTTQFAPGSGRLLRLSPTAD